MTRRRNEGGRYSAKGASDWYRQIEEENIRRIEAESAAKEEAAYLAPLYAAWERQQHTDEYDGAYDDGDLVPWDRAA
jgi:hypothetical protein